MLTEQGQRWFVCGALAGKRVRVERFDGKLLVSYRHMYIREVDPANRKSYPLVTARSAASRESAPVALRAPCADSAAPKSKEKQTEEV
jgi:hypothetical protein